MVDSTFINMAWYKIRHINISVNKVKIHVLLNLCNYHNKIKYIKILNLKNLNSK